MIRIFTICSNNYLAQAVTLGKSLLFHNPGYSFVICLVDRDDPAIDYTALPFEVTEAEKVGITDWDRLILKYNVQELNTAVKPFFFNYLIQRSKPSDKIIYLDPDIVVYNPFRELETELELNDIVIIPHITSSIEDDKTPSETDFLKVGIYNLGFLAISISANSKKMISWWAERMIDKGYNDVKKGMFTDQIWINFVPVFFEKVKIFTHPGYNMAYWNLHERKITEHEPRLLVNDIYPLVFFHFSGFSPSSPENISKYQNRYTFSERSDILKLFKDYCSLLESNNYSYYRSFECYYTGIKESYDDERVLRLVKKIPLWKRVAKKFINYIVKRFDILLDYRIFYGREYSDRQ